MDALSVYPSPQSLAEAAADSFAELARQAAARRGVFRVALAGGSTPQRLYETLARPPYLQTVPWAQVQCFWADERCVPADHPDSNYRLAWRTLLQGVPIPVENIYRMPGELPPFEAAAAYEARLRELFSLTWPRFDLVLLGLGEDGHTASLFPGSPALQQTSHWVIPVEHTSPPPPLVQRLTLSLPVLNAAAEIIFLVSGAQKAGVLAQLLQRSQMAANLPAGLIRPTQGRLRWFADQDAAHGIRSRQP
jgi:6-phosphogluconolactonase